MSDAARHVAVRGARLWPRALKGLFGGKRITTGNQISFSGQRTRRKWFPNIQRKVFYSELLQRHFRLQVTTRVLRTIDKKGGFDNYLLLTPPEKLDLGRAIELRELLVKARWVKNQHKRFASLELRRAVEAAAAAGHPNPYEAGAAAVAARAASGAATSTPPSSSSSSPSSPTASASPFSAALASVAAGSRAP
jgi:large subunit ribosomal protein L28